MVRGHPQHVEGRDPVDDGRAVGRVATVREYQSAPGEPLGVALGDEPGADANGNPLAFSKPSRSGAP